MPRRLRILVISHTYVTPENRGKLEELGKLADVRALVPEKGEDVSGPLVVRASDAKNYDLRPLPIRGRILPGTRWLFRECTSAWKGFDPDVVLIEQEAWSLAMLQGLAMRARYARRSMLGVYIWENQRRPGIKGPMTSPFFRLVINQASLFFTANRDSRALLKSMGAPEARIVVMPQVGLDPEKLCPVDDQRRRELRRLASLPVDTFLIGAAGRLVPEKGYPELLEALDSLRASGRNVHLAAMGSGPLEAELRRHAGVSLLPARPRHEIAPFYQALDVFVLASRTTRAWKEQFGMVAAEAMSCGVPVVGSDSGAIPDVVGSGGLIFSEGQATAMAAAIDLLVQNPRKRCDLGAAGRQRSGAQYSHRSLADRVASVLPMDGLRSERSATQP